MWQKHIYTHTTPSQVSLSIFKVKCVNHFSVTEKINMQSTASFHQLIFYKNNEDKIYFPKSLPSSGTTVRATVFPASLISCTMSLCDSSIMDWPFTAEMRSPTFSRPLRSVGLPSMMRPILWGITGDREINGYFIYTY